MSKNAVTLSYGHGQNRYINSHNQKFGSVIHKAIVILIVKVDFNYQGDFSLR